MASLHSPRIETPRIVTANDAELAERVRLGDDEALAALFERHAEAIYHLTFRLLGSRDDAEDAVQDVFVGLRLALGKYEERGTFGAWLRRLAARTALMRLRSARTRAMREAAAEVTVESAPPQDDHVERALAALPAGMRAVVVLKALEGHGHEEVARLLGISVSASKVRF